MLQKGSPLQNLTDSAKNLCFVHTNGSLDQKINMRSPTYHSKQGSKSLHNFFILLQTWENLLFIRKVQNIYNAAFHHNMIIGDDNVLHVGGIPVYLFVLPVL